MKKDIEIYADVMEKLSFDPAIDNTHIAVAVNDGIAKLEGKVKSYFDKWAAETAVKKVAGVRAVVNELIIEAPEKFHVADTDIAAAILRAFEWDITIPHNDIQVTVNNGQVTLSGVVNWWYQRDNAEKATRRIAGVKSINNQIAIKPQVSVKNVKSEIVKEFHRNAQIDAQNIQVSVDGNKVTLTGRVRSWAEYKEAERGAWSAFGVNAVDNRLEVSYQ